MSSVESKVYNQKISTRLLEQILTSTGNCEEIESNQLSESNEISQQKHIEIDKEDDCKSLETSQIEFRSKGRSINAPFSKNPGQASSRLTFQDLNNDICSPKEEDTLRREFDWGHQGWSQQDVHNQINKSTTVLSNNFETMETGNFASQKILALKESFDKKETSQEKQKSVSQKEFVDWFKEDRRTDELNEEQMTDFDNQVLKRNDKKLRQAHLMNQRQVGQKSAVLCSEDTNFDHNCGKSPQKEKDTNSFLNKEQLNDVDDNHTNFEVSQNQSANASHLMKSLMKSYNAGNVQFYENLHKKYFDMAKDRQQQANIPQNNLLDLSKSHIKHSYRRESSISRSRSPPSVGENKNEIGKNLVPPIGQQIPQISMLKDSNGTVISTNNWLTSRGADDQTSRQEKSVQDRQNKTISKSARGFQTKNLSQSRKMQENSKNCDGTILVDESHLFELTEQSNTVYGGMSQFNKTQQDGQAQLRHVSQLRGNQDKMHTEHEDSENQDYGNLNLMNNKRVTRKQRNSDLSENEFERKKVQQREKNANSYQSVKQAAEYLQPEIDYCNTNDYFYDEQRQRKVYNVDRNEEQSQEDKISIEFKNSLYSKIRYDPSVANQPSMMVSARHFPTHSDASISQISAFGFTNKVMQKSKKLDGVSSIGDQSEIPIEKQSFFTGKRKLLSSGSSPEIDLTKIVSRNSQQKRQPSQVQPFEIDAFNPQLQKYSDMGGQVSTKSRHFRASRGKSVPLLDQHNLNASLKSSSQNDSPQQKPDFEFYDKVADDMSRRDLSARMDPSIDENRSRQDNLGVASPPSSQNFLTHLNQKHKSNFDGNCEENQGREVMKLVERQARQQIEENQFSPIPEGTRSLHLNQITETNQTHVQGEPKKVKRQISDMNLNEHKQGKSKESQNQDQEEFKSSQIDIFKAYQEQVRIARAKKQLQAQSCCVQDKVNTEINYTNANQVIQSQLMKGTTNKNIHLLNSCHGASMPLQGTSSQKLGINNFTTNPHNLSLDGAGDGQKSDFTFVLSNPTHFQDCNQCGVQQSGIGGRECSCASRIHQNNFGTNSEMVDFINQSDVNNDQMIGGIRQNQQNLLQSSVCDTAQQLRKRMMQINFPNSISAGTENNGFNYKNQISAGKGGTASFPDGILPQNNSYLLQQNQNYLQSDQSSAERFSGKNNGLMTQQMALVAEDLTASLKLTEQSANKSSGRTNNRLLNRLSEIAASPIFSESGGNPGRKFYLNSRQNLINIPTQQLSQQFKNTQPNLNKLDQNNLIVEEIESEEEMNAENDQKAQVLVDKNEYISQINPTSGVQETSELQIGQLLSQGNQISQALQVALLQTQGENQTLRQGLWLAYNLIQNLVQTQGELSEVQRQDGFKVAEIIQGLITEEEFEENECLNAEQNVMQSDQSSEKEVQKQEFNQKDQSDQTAIMMNKSPSLAECLPFSNNLQVKDLANKEDTNDFQIHQVDNKNRHEEKLNHNQQEVYDIRHNSLISSLANKKSIHPYNLADQKQQDRDDFVESEYSFLQQESEIVLPPLKMTAAQRANLGKNSTTIGVKDINQIDEKRGKNVQILRSDQQSQSVEKSLFEAQKQLKNERKMNQEQGDMLKQMQAQINFLSQKWQITENQLKNGNMMQQQPLQASHVPFSTHSTLLMHQNLATKSNLTSNLQTQTTPPPIIQSSSQNLPLSQTKIPQNDGIENRNTTIPNTFSSLQARLEPNNTSNQVDLSPQIAGQTISSTFSQPPPASQKATPPIQIHQFNTIPSATVSVSTFQKSSAQNRDSSPQTQITQQDTTKSTHSKSRQLIELNERLAQQIKTNQGLLNSINKKDSKRELEKVMLTSESETDKPVNLQFQTQTQANEISRENKVKNEKMKEEEIQVEESKQFEKSLTDHEETMSQLRARQELFTKKIEKIEQSINEESEQPKKEQRGQNKAQMRRVVNKSQSKLSRQKSKKREDSIPTRDINRNK